MEWIGPAAVVVAAVVGAGVAYLSSRLTAAQMRDVTQLQIDATAEAERLRFLRELRERRVAGVRACLVDLRAAVRGAITENEIEETVKTAADLPSFQQPHAPRGGHQRRGTLGDQLREALRADEGVGEPQLDIVRTLGQLQVAVPPDASIRAALHEVHTRWSGPMVEQGLLDFSRESLVALLSHIDAIEAAVDNFVVGASE